MSAPSLSIIIPALDEERNLPHVLPRIPALPELGEVILVDGHSKDTTVRVAQELMPQIKVIYQRGKGKGDAVRSGVQAAQGEFFLVLDADGSHRPEEIPLYLEKAREGYDLVKGSRYLDGKRHTDDETLDRRVMVGLTHVVTNALWRTRFTDIGYGMLLMRRQRFLDLDIRANRLEMEYEIAAKATRHGLRIVEIPAHEDRRLHGRSRLSYIRDGRLIAQVVFREYFRGFNGKS